MAQPPVPTAATEYNDEEFPIEQSDFVTDETFIEQARTVENAEYVENTKKARKAFRLSFKNDDAAAKSVFPGELFGLEFCQDTGDEKRILVGINEQKFCKLLIDPEIKFKTARRELMCMPANIMAIYNRLAITEREGASIFARSFAPALQVYTSPVSMLIRSPAPAVGEVPGPRVKQLFDLVSTVPQIYTMLTVVLNQMVNSKFSHSSTGRRLRAIDGTPLVSDQELKKAELRQSRYDQLVMKVQALVKKDELLATHHLAEFYRPELVKVMLPLDKIKLGGSYERLAQHQYAVRMINALERGIMRLAQMPDELTDILLTPTAIPIKEHQLPLLDETCDRFAKLVCSITLKQRKILRVSLLEQLSMYALSASDDWTVPADLPKFTIVKEGVSEPSPVPAPYDDPVKYDTRFVAEASRSHVWNVSHVICQLSLMGKKVRQDFQLAMHRLYVHLKARRAKMSEIPQVIFDCTRFAYSLDALATPPGKELCEKFDEWATRFTRIANKINSAHQSECEIIKRTDCLSPSAFQLKMFGDWFDSVSSGESIGWPQEIVPVSVPVVAPVLEEEAASMTVDENKQTLENPEPSPAQENETAPPEQAPPVPVASARIAVQFAPDEFALTPRPMGILNLLPVEVPHRLLRECQNAADYMKIVGHYAQYKGEQSSVVIDPDLVSDEDRATQMGNFKLIVSEIRPGRDLLGKAQCAIDIYDKYGLFTVATEDQKKIADDLRIAIADKLAKKAARKAASESAETRK